MRRILAAAATLGLAGLGAIVPAAGAQASEACDNAWAATPSGSLRAYRDIHCSVILGTDDGSDSNWADSSGAFQGTDNDAASSLVHKGTSGMHLRFFVNAGETGGYTCLAKAEYYMDSVVGYTFSSGVAVNDNISAHDWVWSCDRFLDS